MTFNEWFYEVEGFALRSERFYEDLEYYAEDDAPRVPKRVLEWLKAAYEVGLEEGKANS